MKNKNEISYFQIQKVTKLSQPQNQMTSWEFIHQYDRSHAMVISIITSYLSEIPPPPDEICIMFSREQFSDAIRSSQL